MIMEFYEVLEPAAGFTKSGLSWLNNSPKQLEVSTASEFPVRKEEVPQNTVRVRREQQGLSCTHEFWSKPNTRPGNEPVKGQEYT